MNNGVGKVGYDDLVIIDAFNGEFIAFAVRITEVTTERHIAPLAAKLAVNLQHAAEVFRLAIADGTRALRVDELTFLSHFHHRLFRQRVVADGIRVVIEGRHR